MAETGVPGLSKSRLEMLCDGLFAIVMTLLVLEIGIPAHAEVHDEEQLAHRLVEMLPEVLCYAMSFAILASFWFAHHFEFTFYRRTDRRHTWINILLMLAITCVPVSTALLGEFLTYRLAVIVYAGNMALAGFLLLWNWQYATRGGRLTVEGFSEPIGKAVSVRLLVYASLFVVAMAVAVVNTVVGLAVCVAVPVVYIVMQVVPHAIDAGRGGAPESAEKQ